MKAQMTRLLITGHLGILAATIIACGSPRQGKGPKPPPRQPLPSKDHPLPAAPQKPAPFILIGDMELFLDQAPVIWLDSSDWNSRMLGPMYDRLRALSRKWAERHPGKKHPRIAALCGSGKSKFGKLSSVLHTCYRAGFQQITLSLKRPSPGEPAADRSVRSGDCDPVTLPPIGRPGSGRHLEIMVGDDGYTLTYETGKKDFPLERFTLARVNKGFDRKRLKQWISRWRRLDRTVKVSVEDEVPFEEVVAVLEMCRAMKYQRIDLSDAEGSFILPFKEPFDTRYLNKRPGPAGRQRYVGYGTGVFGRSEVRGAVNHDVIRRIFIRHINEVKYCHRQLKISPRLSGKLKLKFTITATGQVADVQVQTSTTSSAALDGCIMAAFKRWLFPKPDGGGTAIVTVPIALRNVPIQRK